MYQPRPYKINLRFDIGLAHGQLYVSRGKDGDRAVASGFTRNSHGWGKEIHLLHLIKKKLEAAGIRLAKVRIADDFDLFGHLFGDDHMNYLRTPVQDKSAKSDQPHIWIVDTQYAVRATADDYNKGEEVWFEVQGDIYQDKDKPPKQPHWWKLLYNLCKAANIPCEITKECAALL